MVDSINFNNNPYFKVVESPKAPGEISEALARQAGLKVKTNKGFFGPEQRFVSRQDFLDYSSHVTEQLERFESLQKKAKERLASNVRRAVDKFKAPVLQRKAIEKFQTERRERLQPKIDAKVLEAVQKFKEPVETKKANQKMVQKILLGSLGAVALAALPAYYYLNNRGISDKQFTSTALATVKPANPTVLENIKPLNIFFNSSKELATVKPKELATIAPLNFSCKMKAFPITLSNIKPSNAFCKISDAINQMKSSDVVKALMPNIFNLLGINSTVTA